jgi:DNA-binding CsgD family transcriptional regulator
MLSQKTRLLFEVGEWKESGQIAQRLISKERQTPVNLVNALAIAGSLQMRRALTPEAFGHLEQAVALAGNTGELQRILPALAAMLEWEWLSGEYSISSHLITRAIEMTKHSFAIFAYNEFVFWLRKSRQETLDYRGGFIGCKNIGPDSPGGATFWKKAGCVYESAIALFDNGDDHDKRQAVSMLDQLGAKAVCEKLRTEMRVLGIKSIPRGMRKTTESNPSQLTNRELDVLRLLQEGLPNKLIAGKLFISAKTADHHISSILFKLQASTRQVAVTTAIRQGILVVRNGEATGGAISGHNGQTKEDK